ncbi:MAG: hypothetical protein ACPL2F_07630, partial [Dissulfurimicrobium hydrothermale]
MNHAARGFQISFLLHVVLLSLVFGLSHSIRWNKRPPIVIDFSIADDMKGVEEKAALRHLKADVRKETGVAKYIVHRSTAKAAVRAVAGRPIQRPAHIIEEEVIANKETAPVHEAAKEMPTEADGDASDQPAPDDAYKPGQISGQSSDQSGGHSLSVRDEQ